MSNHEKPAPFDTELLERLARIILGNLTSMTDEPVGLHIMICTHGMNMRVSNMNTSALKEALALAMQKLEVEGVIH